MKKTYLTKREALKKIGYKPKCGRPSIADEPTQNVPVRLPLSIVEEIPAPRGPWIRKLVMKKLRG